jgi:MFS family permease
MPIPITIEDRLIMRKKGDFPAFYSALLLLSLHWAIVVYVNSSYLEQFVSHTAIGALYICSTLLTIIIFLSISPLLTRYGNVRITLWCTAIEFLALVGMAFAASPLTALLLFIVHQAIAPLILFTLDIFMEELIGSKEGGTGGYRGLFLTITSLTAALATLGVGKLLGAGAPHFSLAYLVSAGILVPFLYIILCYFRNFTDPTYQRLQIASGISQFWNHRDIRNVFFAHLLLQVFFSWMVIYTPVFLTANGFNWEQIGTILFVGLMAYVLFEYGIGYVADHFIGEKEMMAFGFAVIGVTASWFAFLDGGPILTWMVAMFLTRVGASLVESTTESYFFKHTQGKDANIIGLFRIAQPLGYMVGAGLGVIVLSILPFNLIFIVLGLLMMPGLFFAMALKDTK